MALSDRPGFQRLVDAAEDRLGVTVRPTAQVATLERVAEEYSEFREEAIELAIHSLDYLGGRPTELLPEARRRLAQRSRIALMRDPLAGAEAQHLANFAFGKGVGMPQGQSPEVHKAIEDAWTDPNNMDKLVSPFALRKLSNDLITQGEFFLTLYESNGYVRVSRLNADDVEHVVPDEPEDRLRPLWYMVRKRKGGWNFNTDMAEPTDTLDASGGAPKVIYYPHWRNVQDAERERELDPTAEPLRMPPKKKRGKAVVYHVAINQLGENLRGNPPWQRTLRFYSAMNQFTESRVAMAQGAAAFIAKRVVAGGPKTVTKAATSILMQTGELGTARLSGGEAGDSAMLDPASVRDRWGNPPPPPQGAWWTENEESRLESMNLQSGAAAAAQDSQIIRAPLAAASGFGQHYLGDASNANLATATSLELPALMTVGWWQEVFEQALRWFTERAIEARVQSGRMGGDTARRKGVIDSGRPLSELRLAEAEDKAEMESRTDKKLDYTFTMPYPGRRNLPDVVSLVTTVAAEYDPDGKNEALREALLNYLFTHGMEMEDPGELTAKVLADMEPFESRLKPPVIEDPTAKPGDEQAKPGERPKRGARQSRTPEDAAKDQRAREQEWLPADMRSTVDDLTADTTEQFRALVTDPAVVAALQLAGSPNGTGG